MLNKLIVFLSLASLSLWAVSLPNIQHWKTKNGSRVYFVEAPELPMVDIKVVFDAGASRDEKLQGVALLTNALITEGTKNMNANQIAEYFDNLGAQIGNSSLRDMSGMEFRSLSDGETLNKVVDMAAEIIREPVFPKQAFDREKNRLLVMIKSKKQSPGDIASDAFYESIYGSHPYHSAPEGNEQSIAAIQRDNLVAHHKNYYVAKNATVAVVGALNRKAAEQLIERLIGKLPKGNEAKPIPPVAVLQKPVRLEIQHPSSQTHILLGQPGIRRDDSDYFALYVGNHILGGSGLVSRISDEIREKRGLAYSSYSYFLPMQQNGPFQIGLQTRNDQFRQALEVLQDTVKKFIEQGPTKDKLIQAKQNITGGFALRLDSNKEIANYLSVIGFYNLPLDYLNTFNKKVEAVTVEQIKTAFQKRSEDTRLNSSHQ